jgi:hypothetical protein
LLDVPGLLSILYTKSRYLPNHTPLAHQARFKQGKVLNKTLIRINGMITARISRQGQIEIRQRLMDTGQIRFRQAVKLSKTLQFEMEAVLEEATMELCDRIKKQGKGLADTVMSSSTDPE